MRVAFDAKRYFNNRTGLGNYSRSLVHSLAKNFPEHEFILMHEDPKKPLADFDNLSCFAPKNAGLFWRNRGVVNDLREQQIDIYHGLSNEIPIGIGKIKIPSVVTIHDAIFMRYPEYYSSFDRSIYRWKTRYALKNANAVIATSKATAMDLNTFFAFEESHATVIYQPVSDSFSHVEVHASPVHGNYFIYVSSFTARKNHGALIEAFARIRKMTDWNLVLAGAGGEMLEKVRNFIRHEKLESRVHIFENVEENALISLLKNASGFVYPSLFEGFGIPLAEAATLGVPIAASDIPVFRELAENAAIYFHPNKFEEIADSMLKLTSPEVRVELAKNNHLILHKIQEEEIAKQVMAVYKSLVPR
jgi:glycosyltransferase involved in cell wall biosynthesis